MFYFTSYPSPIGPLTLACDGSGENLAGLWIQGQKYFLDTLPEKPLPAEDCPIFQKARRWLDSYFAGERPDIFALNLSPIGGEFRQAVWKLLRQIPYGQVMSYGEISRQIAAQRGLPHMSSQAVGGAVGHNPISIIIPCHRVVGVNGSLTGYAGGIDKKAWLLRHEGADLSKLYPPQKGSARKAPPLCRQGHPT